MKSWLITSTAHTKQNSTCELFKEKNSFVKHEDRSIYIIEAHPAAALKNLFQVNDTVETFQAFCLLKHIIL